MVAVRIEGQRQAPADHIQGIEAALASGWRVKVTCADKQKDIQLNPPASAEEEELLRWYLEEYAINDPFNSLQARAARHLIRSYSQSLVQNLDLGSILPADGDNDHIVLEVFESAQSSPSVHSIHWEFLERVELWPDLAPKSVCVTRVVLKDAQDTARFANSEVRIQEQPVTILVVSSRPQSDDDIPHRIVSQKILDVKRRLPESRRQEVHVKIVRPGTFDAFVDALKDLNKDHFNLVHFDMHGERENESDRCD
jgi:hypothetical protein